LVLPNAWDVASARAVVDAGFPVVATTSAGVAAALGHEDHEEAPAQQMLAAAARIAKSVEVPVTVDAESGYGLGAQDLVAALSEAGAAGCNLEDTDHDRKELRDVHEQAERLRTIGEAASAEGYPLVINARIDIFLPGVHAGSDEGQEALVGRALERARAYLDAGADCVYPIALWESGALERLVTDTPGPVNVLRIPPAPSLADMAALGVARVSYGGLLHHDVMGKLARELEAISSDVEGLSEHRRQRDAQ
jgi:2-methylisocitrate lyase-like PEP mutase family enzyme